LARKSRWKVGVQLNQQPPPQIRRKFRRPGRISASVRRNSAANYPIERCVASRVDGEWIHGRGKDQNYSSLANTRLAFIGCGALGSNLSRLLMQAGVGECLFVDHDTFESHNIYRHILGHSWIGANKAAAMAKQLRSDFPHCRSTSSINSKFENLSSPQLDILAEFDILISAGIPIETEAAISAWRLSLDDPIPQISSWIEPFGVAGHSVVIMDEDSLLDKYNAFTVLANKIFDTNLSRFIATRMDLQNGSMGIDKAVVKHVKQHVQRRPEQTEAGGQLFGHVRSGCLRIRRATGPYKDDERGKIYYRSCPKEAQKSIEQMAKLGLLYVGEWHTHFEPHPQPSIIDRRSMSKIWAESKLNIDKLVLLIVGNGLVTDWYIASIHEENTSEWTISIRDNNSLVNKLRHQLDRTKFFKFYTG